MEMLQDTRYKFLRITTLGDLISGLKLFLVNSIFHAPELSILHRNLQHPKILSHTLKS